MQWKHEQCKLPECFFFLNTVKKKQIPGYIASLGEKTLPHNKSTLLLKHNPSLKVVLAVMFTFEVCLLSISRLTSLSLCVAAGQVSPWSRSSKSTGTSSTWVRHQQKKPSEVSGAVDAHVRTANVRAAYEPLLCCLLCGPDLPSVYQLRKGANSFIRGK